MTVAGLVLAAGGGSRFGRPKALVSFDGELLVERAVATLADAGCDPVTVVLGAGAAEVTGTADLRAAHVVHNAGWATGMASSLHAGLAALRPARCDAAVVVLVDQPLVSAEAVRRLVAAWQRGARAAVATYAGARRHPVLLDRGVWDDVAATAVGDEGARRWLQSAGDVVVDVPCDGIASPADIDTPRDLARLL